MDTVTIRNEIDAAKNHEARTHELENLLLRRLHHLHSTITIDAARPHLQLLVFVCKFIARTPALLDTLIEASHQSNREELCEAVAGTCMEFFMSPPDILAGRRGLNGAMGKAYLCHRIVDELNDCCRVSTRTPMLPVDFTCSNLIIHQLIGEPFANLLDETIHSTTLRLRDVGILSLAEQVAPEGGDRLVKLCQKRALMDENVSSAFTITSFVAGCTIH